MNSILGKSLMSVALGLFCLVGADAQHAQVSTTKGMKAQVVNVGWASLEVELRDIATDNPIEGNITLVKSARPSVGDDSRRAAVLEVISEGYLGGRQHLFVVDPDRKNSYSFVVYLGQPIQPEVQHVAQVD